MSKLLTIFFFPIALLTVYPLGALIPSGFFLVFYLGLRGKAGQPELKRASFWTLVAGLIWLVYALYEFKMHQWAKTVTAPIRVDLLLLTPVLYFFTILGVWNIRRLLKSR
jgi:hypothetical protein